MPSAHPLIDKMDRTLPYVALFEAFLLSTKKNILTGRRKRNKLSEKLPFKANGFVSLTNPYQKKTSFIFTKVL